MYCCCECFSSPYLKDFIITNQIKIGNCNFCGSKKVPMLEAEQLNLIFQNILSLYSVDITGNPVEIQIESDFSNKIFANKVTNSTKVLLQDIIKKDYDSYKTLFENNVSLTISSNPENIKKVKPLQISWENFAIEIKSTNRFHIQNALNLKKLRELLERYEKPIKKGTNFFRARISGKDGFSINEMSNPPSEKAKAGRANPTGISYLYLADQIDTTLYEVRATLFDYVSIAKFKAKEDIRVINLRGNTYDPIVLAEREELEDFLIHLPFISTIEENLAKPKRRSDNELDYLPTQYLSEFIKSIGFDGVEFQSSLYSNGYNIAIFNPNKFECIDVKVHEIKKIWLEHKNVI